MSFGWSVGDILKIVEICNDIRSFCKHAPAELQDLSERLERIGKKLRRLSVILEESGLGVWSETPAVREHLIEVAKFLKPLIEAVRQDASSLTRIKGFFKLSQQQSELKRIQKLLDIDEDAIKELRNELILACSLNNLRYMNDSRDVSSSAAVASSSRASEAGGSNILQALEYHTHAGQPRLTSGPASGNLSLVSETTKAFETAVALRSQSRRRTRPDSITVTGFEGDLPTRENSNDFVTEIVSLAEQAELYSQHVNPASKLIQFSNITKRAPRLGHVANLAAEDDTSSIMSRLQPLTIADTENSSWGQEVYGHLSSSSDNPSVRRWAVDNSRDSPQIKDFPVATISQWTPATSTSGDTLSSGVKSQAYSGLGSDIIRSGSIPDETQACDDTASKSELVQLQSRAGVRLPGLSTTPISCSFEIRESEDSVLLRIITPGKRPNPSLTQHTQNVLIPFAGPSTNTLQFISSSNPTRHVRVFQHCFQTRHRPIPHLLHPSVEGPHRESHEPYKITFSHPQYISEEGAPDHPHWTPSLTYILHSESDRTHLCEHIFGKTLLSVTGSNEIALKSKRVSHLCALALWHDPVSRTLSVTFHHNLIVKPARDVEYKLLGLWDAGRPLKDPRRLVVAIAQMDRSEDSNVLPELSRQTTAGTATSRKSTGSSHRLPTVRRRSSTDDGRTQCTIDFTTPAGRDEFLACLQRQLSAGCG